MKTTILISLSLFLIIPFVSNAQDKAISPFSTDNGRPVLAEESPKIEKLWETKPELTVCESVLPFNGIYYISCINGNGEVAGNAFIALIDNQGKIIRLKWAEGLDSPKGMGIWQNTLYVADIRQVVLIELKTGQIKNRIQIPESKLLNDITIDGNGLVAVSDWKDNAIYFIDGEKYKLFMKDAQLDGVNGLHFGQPNQLYAGTSKGILKIDIAKKESSLIIAHEGGIDGLELVDPNYFITSDWQGHVYLLQEGKPDAQILDLTTEKRNAADICFDNQTHTLYIPTFFGNSVVAYKILSLEGF